MEPNIRKGFVAVVTRPESVEGISSEDLDHIWSMACYSKATSYDHHNPPKEPRTFFEKNEKVLAHAKQLYDKGEPLQLTSYALVMLRDCYSKQLELYLERDALGLPTSQEHLARLIAINKYVLSIFEQAKKLA